MRRLIVGLGNPGARYAHTRHNLGRMAADLLRERGAGEGEVEIAGSDWKPWAETYMNELGRPLATYMRKNGVDPGGLLVIYDELDLPLGQTRFRLGGTSAGHKGVDSIIRSLGTEGFWRIRLGIGTPEQARREIAAEDFVLQPFRPEEAEPVGWMLEAAVEAATHWAADGGSEISK